MNFRRRPDRDFADEIQSHIDHEADRLRASGVAEETARELARRAFGNMTARREQFYESRRALFLDTLSRDVRYAMRGLARSPGYAAAAVLALALGVGANTAIFSAVDEILFRPPDVPAADRLAQIYSFDRKTSTYRSSSYPEYVDFRDQARSFQSLAAYVRLPLNVALNGAVSERVSVEGVSGNYFEMLAVPPLAGRVLRPSDDVPNAAPVAMIAEDLWRTRMVADPAVVGKPILVSGISFLVVGIVPRRVGGLNLNWVSPPRIWIPLRATALAIPNFGRIFDSRGAIWLVLTGRLKPGVSIGSAQAELQTIAARVPGNRDLTAIAFPLSRSKFWPSYRNQIETSLTGFSIAAGLILLLACANVSNLLLGRALVRRRELAVRLAIGAGSGRIVRQLLTEGAVLGGLSGAAGILVAAALMPLLRRFPDALGLPLAVDPRIEPRALGFCLALSLLTIALFALAPALQGARLAIVPSLRTGGNVRSGRRDDWLRASLVALQAAFSIILLIGGGLYLRALGKAYAADPGFRPDHLLTAAFSLPPPGKEAAAQMSNAQRTLLRRLSSMQGVVSAAVSSSELLSPVRPKAEVGLSTGPAQSMSAAYDAISPGFFGTLGMPVLEGKDFASALRDSPGIVIVNRALAQGLSADKTLVGQTISIERPGRPPGRYLVVGVAADAKYSSLWERPEAHFYLPASSSDVNAGFLNIRTSQSPAALAEPVRRLWGELMPAAPLYEVETAEDRVNAVLAPQRVAAAILGAFAGLALILTAVGLYSVVAFGVARRRREIGIRLAVGARPRAIFAVVIRKALIPALSGIVAGAAASVPLMRVVAFRATNVSPGDLPAYAIASLILIGAACAAAVIPARRAMRIDPSVALRAE